MSVTISADLDSLNGFLKSLGDRADEAARPAAQAAADVLYKEVQKNVGQLGKVTGNLSRSIYQVFSKDNSGKGFATYHVSWNARKAPHGHLVEFGYKRRYEYYQDEKGNVRPKVRPGMEGKKPPVSNGRNRAALDAYYVTLPSPVQVPAKSFVRRAESAFPRAIQAAETVIVDYIIKGKK